MRGQEALVGVTLAYAIGCSVNPQNRQPSAIDGGNGGGSGNNPIDVRTSGGTSTVASSEPDVAACNGCPGQAFSLDTPLLTADQVSAVVGSTVQFRGFDAKNGDLDAEVVATGESLLVSGLPYPLGSGTITFYRLPDTANGWHFVTRGFLACSSDSCALFEVANASNNILQPIAGGTVPDGFIGTALLNYQFQLCVANEGPNVWCFDREKWTRIDKATIISKSGPLTLPFKPGNTIPASCGPPTEIDDPIVRWQISSISANYFMGTTAAGQIVTGRWQEGPDCCCARSSPLGNVVDFVGYDCGLSANMLLLTEDGLYGSYNCAVD
jgi:hypothetical protein